LKLKSKSTLFKKKYEFCLFNEMKYYLPNKIQAYSGGIVQRNIIEEDK